ncbi:hypothetical protein ABMC89_01135 [Sulfitobacter sp. HNIBRBA3233]|uniref:hypothetical protein n=1 Tax=Sulfitobacter marinivivus TaxID=3158558 RepID=UPI0032DFC23F
MDWTTLTVALAFVTMIGAVVFAYISKQKVENRMNDSSARKSTLAEDKDSHAKPADV